MTRKVLVVGGSGVFGTRLVHGLLATSDLDVVVAGRDRGRCEAFVAAHDPAQRARLSIAALDASAATAAELRATGAFVVVDAAGPFQGQDLCLPRAAIAGGMHYLDLADGRDFVVRISVLDKAAGVTVLSDGSSTPALSNAALNALTTGSPSSTRLTSSHSDRLRPKSPPMVVTITPCRSVMRRLASLDRLRSEGSELGAKLTEVAVDGAVAHHPLGGVSAVHKLVAGEHAARAGT